MVQHHSTPQSQDRIRRYGPGYGEKKKRRAKKFGVCLWFFTAVSCALVLVDTGSGKLALGDDPKQGGVRSKVPESETSKNLDGLDGRDGRQLSVSEFRPVQKLVVADNTPPHAKFPVIDVHNHFSSRLKDNDVQLDDYVQEMDQHQIALAVSLDGRLGATLKSHQQWLGRHPDRFAVFAHLDFVGLGKKEEPKTWSCNQPGWGERTASDLKEAVDGGLCVGLKLFKSFGLNLKDSDGSLLKIDDPRYDPIWKQCGVSGIPVIIHTADPAAFFDPIDEKNERWEELYRHPSWSFYGDQFPSREELLDARNRMIAKHPKTKFIGAHLANNPEDLGAVSSWLDQYPNLYVEIASRIGELGRQDRRSRQFLIKYADRVMFGTDGPFPPKRLFAYWRFLETFDESFDYSEKNPPPQGLWRIDGVGLPDEVLKKIYHENALQIIPGLRAKYERVIAGHPEWSKP